MQHVLAGGAGAGAGAADDGDGAAPSPLHVAALQGHSGVVALLLRGGYSHTQHTAGGLTPLHLAALGAVRAPPLADSAVIKGGSVSEPQPQPPPGLCCAGGVALLPWLWRPQVSGGLRRGRQSSPLQEEQRRRRGCEEVCRALVAAGADVSAADESGRTLEMCAAGKRVGLWCCGWIAGMMAALALSFKFKSSTCCILPG
jgi:hypothetical protein